MAKQSRATSASGPAVLLRQPDRSVRFEDSQTGQTRDVWTGECGLGRVVVTTLPLEQLLDEADTQWRSVSAHLWKVNHAQLQPVHRSGGVWVESQVDSGSYWQSDIRGAFQPENFTGETELIQLLLPDRVQNIPAWQVISLLAVFLLLIAPGDYILLGLLRRRTLTWILFPTVSLAVTYYTVRLARETVGSSDYVTSLTIADFVDDTTIARTTRIEMLFTAAEREAIVDARDELFTPLVEAKDVDWQEYRSGRRQGRGRNDTSESETFQIGVQNEAPRYEGLLPHHYKVVRHMRKWTPQLCRRSWIGPPPGNLPEFDWKLITPESLATSESRLQLAAVVSATVPEAVVMILHPDDGSGHMSEATVPKSGAAARNASALTKSYSVTTDPLGWASVVSRVSPNGDAGLEDLRMLDRTNPDECLVIITISTADGFVSYRRLYQLASDSG